MFQKVIINSSHVTFKQKRYYSIAHLTLKSLPPNSILHTASIRWLTSLVFIFPVTPYIPFWFFSINLWAVNPCKLLGFMLISRFRSNRGVITDLLCLVWAEIFFFPETPHNPPAVHVPGTWSCSDKLVASRKETGIGESQERRGVSLLAGTVYGPDSLGRGWRNWQYKLRMVWKLLI